MTYRSKLCIFLTRALLKLGSMLMLALVDNMANLPYSLDMKEGSGGSVYGCIQWYLKDRRYILSIKTGYLRCLDSLIALELLIILSSSLIGANTDFRLSQNWGIKFPIKSEMSFQPIFRKVDPLTNWSVL